MIQCTKLKEEYLNEITALINEWKANSSRLVSEGSNDEAVLETIKVNIADIFYKMFNVSFNKSCRNLEPENVELRKLGETYLAFFDKIPAPWRGKMAKDKEHNQMEEYYKEQIKLQTAEQVKNIFVKHYNSCYKEG